MFAATAATGTAAAATATAATATTATAGMAVRATATARSLLAAAATDLDAAAAPVSTTAHIAMADHPKTDHVPFWVILPGSAFGDYQYPARIDANLLALRRDCP